MPEYLRDAVVAIEDRRFYEHDGVDFTGIGRALGANVSAGEVAQGGSTITQQLVKILYTGRERTVTRKIKEALFAYELESKNDKNAVLVTYLNTVYFGRGAYGVEAAAQRYFGKPTSALDLAESATLAGVIRSPSRYGSSSVSSAAVEATTKRRDVVLRQMREQGYITAQLEREARAKPLVFAPSKEAGVVAPYFVEYVKQDLIDTLGAEKVYAGGLRVYTSLDPRLQASAEQAAKQLSVPTDPEVALVSLRPSDGRVLAMIGGRDFKANQFNLAAQGRRQPGSAFKPFVLVAALQEGIGPETGVRDSALHGAGQGWDVDGPELREPVRGRNDDPSGGDGLLGQRRVRPAHHADRSREGRADGQANGDHDRALSRPGDRSRWPEERRLAARDGVGVRNHRERWEARAAERPGHGH